MRLLLALGLLLPSGGAWAQTLPVETATPAPITAPALSLSALPVPSLSPAGTAPAAPLSLSPLPVLKPVESLAVPAVPASPALSLGSAGRPAAEAGRAAVGPAAAVRVLSRALDPVRDRTPAERSAVLGAAFDLSGRSGLAANAVATDAVDAKARLLESVPGLLRDELEQVAPKIRGTPLSADAAGRVLAATSVKEIRWYHFFTKENVGGGGIPNGITFPDSRVQLNLKRGWKGYASVENYFRVLFSHEYTHVLQNEGLIGKRFGVEIPAVAVEILRGIELEGLEGLRSEAIPFIGDGVLGEAGFESGRKWAHSDHSARDGFHFKGFLPGAAYELAQMTGHWSDAWEFVRLVCAREGALEPAAAARRILARP